MRLILMRFLVTGALAIAMAFALAYETSARPAAQQQSRAGCCITICVSGPVGKRVRHEYREDGMQINACFQTPKPQGEDVCESVFFEGQQCANVD